MSLGSFDKGAFDHDLEQFQHNLGELVALEMVEQSFYEWVSGQNSLQNVGAEYYWDVPSRNHPFQWVFITTLFPMYEAEWKGIVEQCWSSGASWAAGIAGHFRELCQRWAEPDAGEIVEQAQLLESKVANDLEQLFSDDWSANADRGTSLNKTMGHWEGRAATSFGIFYDNIDSLANLWAAMASRLAGLWAAHAVVLDAGQQTMMEIISKASKHSDEQLANWAASHQSWPYGSTKGAFTLVEVLDVVGVGATVASFIPPLAPVAGTVGTVAGLVSRVVSASGEGGTENADFTSIRAHDMYRDTIDAMNLKAVVATTSAMINLRSGGSTADGAESSRAGTGDLIGDAEDRGSEFFAPRLRGIDDPQPGGWTRGS